MNFAENNRISHRQLFRQMILTFLAPFLLCLFQKRQNMGINGIIGIIGSGILLIFYLILLFRLTPYYENLHKTAGTAGAVLISLFFLLYIILTGGYLLKVLSAVIRSRLLTDLPEYMVFLLALAVTAPGIHKGLQKRGRMAETSGAIFLWGILLMLLLCLGQGKSFYLQEMLLHQSIKAEDIGKNLYTILCAFSGISLLPFALEDVEKQASGGKTVALVIALLSGILIAMELIFPAIFGWNRLLFEEYPILPLLSGADFPGNILARFDILWLGLLIYGMLFSIGSLLHYGSKILHKAGAGTGRGWLWLLLFVIAYFRFWGYGIEAYYSYYLSYIFVPLTILFQLILLWKSIRKKRKKLAIAASLLCIFFLNGCGAIEPENRMYPLAMGVDIEEEQLVFSYGTAELKEATGQEKPEEKQGQGVLSIKGKTFEDIQRIYDETQEKYLDLGHLQVLILDQKIMENGLWRELFSYLKENPYIGENVYVFSGENAREILSWTGASDCSVGEYITGMLENRTNTEKKKGITIRDLYYKKYEGDDTPVLPEIWINEQQLQIKYSTDE